MPPQPTDLERIRQLLLQPEQQTLDELSDPETWHRHVSQVLPQAIIKRSKSDESLKKALTPVLQEVLSDSIKRNPRLLADLLFPIMLPALRKALAEMLAESTASINLALDNAFSARGLRWRMEALSTGRSFGDVAMSHLMIYRGEQALLIHHDTGLPLAHAVAKGVSAQDGAMVSGMLSAISDFARDSFDPNAELNAIAMGEKTLLVERGASADLAVVTRGNPTLKLKQQMQDMLHEVHASHQQALEGYQGDNSAFEGLEGDLTQLLTLELKTTPPPSSMGAPLVVGAVLAAMLGVWLWNAQQQRQWNNLVSTLEATPGISIIAQHKGSIKGLRDPLAQIPDGLIPANTAQQWEAFQSLDPDIALKRLRSELNLDQQVTLTQNGDSLIVSGYSPQAFELYQTLKNKGYSKVNLLSLNSFGDKLKDLIQDMEGIQLDFKGNSIAASNRPKLAQLLNLGKEFERLQKATGYPYSVKLIGYASNTEGKAVGFARAKTLEGALPVSNVKLGYTLVAASSPSNAKPSNIVRIRVEEKP